MSDLDDFQAKIDAARKQASGADDKKGGAPNENSREGVQAGIELVGAIFVGGAIGYGLDYWLDTKPLFMITLFFLGVFTGFYNVYRVTQNLGTGVGVSKNSKKAHNSDLSDEIKDATNASEQNKD